MGLGLGLGLGMGLGLGLALALGVASPIPDRDLQRVGLEGGESDLRAEREIHGRYGGVWGR